MLGFEILKDLEMKAIASLLPVRVGTLLYCYFTSFLNYWGNEVHVFFHSVNAYNGLTRWVNFLSTDIHFFTLVW